MEHGLLDMGHLALDECLRDGLGIGRPRDVSGQTEPDPDGGRLGVDDGVVVDGPVVAESEGGVHLGVGSGVESVIRLVVVFVDLHGAGVHLRDGLDLDVVPVGLGQSLSDHVLVEVLRHKLRKVVSIPLLKREFLIKFRGTRTM